jgi:hypothetical protein
MMPHAGAARVRLRPHTADNDASRDAARNFAGGGTVHPMPVPKEGSTVREEPFNRLRESSYRITILVVVIGCHLGLLMPLLRPVIFRRDATPVAGNNPLVLRLRLFRPPPLSLPPPVQSSITTPSARPSRSPAVQQAAHVDAQPYETRSTKARNRDTSEEDSSSDGGFQERLHTAQRSYSVHGVPGSDTPFAPGIHLVDPMSQGIGAVMRKAQRAFGIKNSHCIDVDVWRHLTPQELSARHISPGDVDELDEKYGCNEPPGLRF